MTGIAAGAKVLASVINASIPYYQYTTATSTKTSSTALGDITGFVVALEADSVYAWDAYLAYNAGATGDLKVAFTVPASTTGHWALWGLSTGSTASVGDMVGTRVDAYGDANTLAIGGSDSLSGFLACRPCGYIDTAGTAGNFQGRFAQNTSSGTSTIIQIGSWIRIVKVA